MALRVIVFGGTGWVGHHIALAMYKVGHDVTVVSRRPGSRHAAALPKELTIRNGDKSNAKDVDALLKDKYDVVFDSVPTAESIGAVARSADRFGHYIHCSSTGGYAPLVYVPGDESLPYDHFLGGWAQKHDVDTLALKLMPTATVIRPTNIIGPGAVPLDNVGGRRREFIGDIVNGRPIVLPEDGNALLQPVHVADLGRIFRLAAEHRGKCEGEIYIATQPRAVTLTRYIEITASAFGMKPVITYASIDQILESQGKDCDELGLRFLATHMCFSIAKAQRDLGYEPVYDVERAIIETAHWARQETGC